MIVVCAIIIVGIARTSVSPRPHHSTPARVVGASRCVRSFVRSFLRSFVASRRVASRRDDAPPWTPEHRTRDPSSRPVARLVVAKFVSLDARVELGTGWGRARSGRHSRARRVDARDDGRDLERVVRVASPRVRGPRARRVDARDMRPRVDIDIDIDVDIDVARRGARAPRGDAPRSRVLVLVLALVVERDVAVARRVSRALVARLGEEPKRRRLPRRARRRHGRAQTRAGVVRANVDDERVWRGGRVSSANDV